MQVCDRAFGPFPTPTGPCRKWQSARRQARRRRLESGTGCAGRLPWTALTSRGRETGVKTCTTRERLPDDQCQC
jgi:hypothetical protein